MWPPIPHPYKPLLECHVHDEAFHIVPHHKGENTEFCDWLHLGRGSQKETEQGRHEGYLWEGSGYMSPGTAKELRQWGAIGGIGARQGYSQGH